MSLPVMRSHLCGHLGIIALALFLPACSRPAPMPDSDKAVASRGASPRSSEPSAYEVIREDGDQAKEIFYIRLARKMTQEQLRALSVEIKAAHGGKRPRTIIWYSLPGRRCPEDAWAFADLDPDPKMEMRGLSAEEERALLAKPLPSYAELLGVWLDDRDGAKRFAIYRAGASFFLSEEEQGGGEPRPGYELAEESEAGKDRKFRRKDIPKSTDRYWVLADGTFEIRDKVGLYLRAPRVPAPGQR